MAFDPTGFSISTYERDGRAVVLVRGELDLATAPDLDEVLGELQEGGREIVVDLRELAFMDSSGLRTLVAAHARAEAGAPAFSVVRPLEQSPIARIFAIAGIESALHLVDDV